jgi:hypothetical protein
MARCHSLLKQSSYSKPIHGIGGRERGLDEYWMSIGHGRQNFSVGEK